MYTAGSSLPILDSETSYPLPPDSISDFRAALAISQDGSSGTPGRTITYRGTGPSESAATQDAFRCQNMAQRAADLYRPLSSIAQDLHDNGTAESAGVKEAFDAMYGVMSQFSGQEEAAEQIRMILSGEIRESETVASSWNAVRHTKGILWRYTQPTEPPDGEISRHTDPWSGFTSCFTI
jgi:hypothetical protein